MSKWADSFSNKSAEQRKQEMMQREIKELEARLAQCQKELHAGSMSLSLQSVHALKDSIEEAAKNIRARKRQLDRLLLK